MTAAGNYGEQHWGGQWNDPDNNGSHNFSSGNAFNHFGPGDGSAYGIPAGYPIVVTMRWDDWSAVNQDFDLKLAQRLGPGWLTVDESTNPQNGSPGQEPVETVAVISAGGAYAISIVRHNATRDDLNFEVFVRSPSARLDEIVPERSLAHPADAPSVVAVASVDVSAPYYHEAYSSQGPTHGPGGTTSGGAIKPDVASYANVSTVSYGNRGFAGTSAATPHVAGAAALIAHAFSGYTPDQIRSYLEGHAVDMGGSGQDNRFGWGRLDMGSPPTVCYTLTPTHTGSGSDPAATPANSAGCPAGQYLFGTVVQLSAAPTVDWQVTGWSGSDDDNSSAENNSVTMPASDHSVSVAYSPICYTLTLNHTGSGGDPVATPDNSAGCPAGQYVSAAVVQLNAAPDTGWEVTGWSGSDDDASSAENNSVTIPVADHSVSVAYSPICYTLTLNHTGSGSDPAATPANSAGCPAGQYLFGAEVQLDAQPARDWQVTGWSGSDDDASSAENNNVTMPAADHNVSVAYSPICVHANSHPHRFGRRPDGDTGQLGRMSSGPIRLESCGPTQRRTRHWLEGHGLEWQRR